MFCWLFKFLISNTMDAGNELSERAKKHIRRCADCRSFYETHLSLGDALRRRAADFDEHLPAHFARRVFDAASPEAGPTLRLPVRRFRPVLAAACILIVASLAAVLLTVGHEDPKIDPPDISLDIPSIMNDGRPAAWAGLVKKPLSDELENVTNGTESAVRFLVACVAVNPAKTNYKITN